MPKISALSNKEVEEILGASHYQDWQEIYKEITDTYEMDEEWHTANRGNSFELKFRRGGKTLVSLFPAFSEEFPLGVMIIFGQAEREKFADIAEELTSASKDAYEEAKTFRDGKWVMFSGTSPQLKKDLLSMLAVKRKPNKK